MGWQPRDKKKNSRDELVTTAGTEKIDEMCSEQK